MLLARFLRCPAVLMKLFYPKIPKIRLCPDGPVSRVSDGCFVYLEIVRAAFPLPDIYDFPRLPVDYRLRLYRMALFLAGMPLFLFFLGRWTGLSVTADFSPIPPHTVWRMMLLSVFFSPAV
jgi:hypothetical protein